MAIGNGAMAVPERSQAIDSALVEQVLIKGDLRQLTSAQKVSYYTRVCESLGLNPLTQPFAYITLNGKEVLYAKRDAAEQLRKVHTISVTITAREVIEGVYVVTAGASMPSGRRDESTGAVPIETLKGEARANAMMKAETKAKRRVTLSICGLGMLDETEVESLQPTYVVEAPKRVDLPAGAAQILTVLPASDDRRIAIVTWVDDKGEQHEAKTPFDIKGGAAALAEQLAQEACPVVITTRVNRNQVTVIDELRRWTSPEPVAEAAASPLTAADIAF